MGACASIDNVAVPLGCVLGVAGLTIVSDSPGRIVAANRKYTNYSKYTVPQNIRAHQIDPKIENDHLKHKEAKVERKHKEIMFQKLSDQTSETDDWSHSHHVLIFKPTSFLNSGNL